MTPGDSGTQLAAEKVILAAVSDRIGVALAPASFKLPGGARVDVDGASADRSVLVECFARQTAMKEGQRRKIARDALKLITIAHSRPGTRLILALSSEAAARGLLGEAWLAEALRTWGVEVLAVDIDAEVTQSILDAQKGQMMVYPETKGSEE